MAEPKTRIPRPVRGADLRSLPLSPVEGFVLSRVDGAATVADIADLTNLSVDMVTGTLDKLVGLDAIEWADGSTGLPRPSVRPPGGHSGAPSPQAAGPGGLHTPPAARAGPRPGVKVFAAPPPRSTKDFGTPLEALIPPPQATIPVPTASPIPEALLPSIPDPPVPAFPDPPAPLADPTIPDPPTVPHPTLSDGSYAHATLPQAPRPLSVVPEPLPPPSTVRTVTGYPAPTPPPQRERPAGMHVYSAKQESEPPIVETFEAHRPPVHRSPPPAGPPRSTRPLPSAPPAGTSRILTRPPSSTATPSQPPKSSSSPAPKVNSASQKPASPSPAPSTSTGPQRSATAAMGAAEGEIDLPEDRRKKIDELYVVVDLLDHYQVLGIERDADRAKVKASYFELSKQFHPDTAFRKNVGSYRQKMEVIFKRLTEAYDVLSKKKAREEYDAYLSRSEKSHEYEQTLSGHHDLEKAMAAIEAEEARKRDAAKAQREADKAAELEKQQREAERRRAEEQRRLKEEGMGTPATPAVFSPRTGTSPGTRPSSQGIPAVKPPVSAPPPPIPPPTTTAPGVGRPVTTAGATSSPGSTTSPGGHAAPMSEEARQRAKELFTRRLAGSRSNTGPMEPTAPPEPARAPATKAEVVRDLAASLKGVANVTGGLDPAQRHVAEARRSLADGHLAEAVRKLRLAVALAPDDREIKTEHDRLARELAVSLASNYAEQAQYEERHGKWAAAAISWQKVVDGRPSDAACHWRCAKALLESSGDAKQAVRLAQRAVEIEPDNVFAVRTLGRAFMSAGMTLNAKRELEKAVALDPKDEPTKALLKELKGT